MKVMDFPYKGPVMGKVCPCHYVIMGGVPAGPVAKIRNTADLYNTTHTILLFLWGIIGDLCVRSGYQGRGKWLHSKHTVGCNYCPCPWYLFLAHKSSFEYADLTYPPTQPPTTATYVIEYIEAQRFLILMVHIILTYYNIIIYNHSISINTRDYLN